MTNQWLERALTLYKRRDYAEALRVCAAAPRDAQAQMSAATLRASIMMKLARDEEALAEIETAVGLGARATELYRLAATSCIRRKRPAAALDWIERGLLAAPVSSAQLEMRGHLVTDMHLLSGVYQHLERCVALQPQSLEACEKLLHAQLTLRFYENADEHLQIALDLQPQRVALLLQKATVCIETGRAQAAIAVLEDILSRNASLGERQQVATLFIKAGALSHALRTIHANQALAPDDLQVRLQAGFVALWQGDVQTAAACGHSLPEGTPGSSRLRAAIALVEERYGDAERLAMQALSEDRSDAQAHALHGVASFWLGNFAAAEASARAAMQGGGEWSPGVYLLEVTAHISQQSRITHFQVAEVLDLLAPLWPRAAVATSDKRNYLVDPKPVLDTLAHGLRRLSGNFSSAFTFVDESTGKWATFAPRLPARMACLKVFDWFQARPFAWVAERMRSLAALYPRSPYVHTHTAELWLWAGDYRACEEECRKALALSKTDGTRWAWVGLGAALMLQERHDEALAVFAESNRISPPGSPLLAYQGETRRRTGDLDAARADLHRALELSPKRLSVWLNLGLIASLRGEEEEVRDIYAQLVVQMPALLREVELDQPGAGEAATNDAAAMARTFAHALFVMRGNRSSNRITYFLQDGLARLQATRELK